MESSAISSLNTQPYPATPEHQPAKPATRATGPAVTRGSPSTSFAKASGNTSVYQAQHHQVSGKSSNSNQPVFEGQDDLVTFATPEDERRYRDIAKRIADHPIPNAHDVAKEFIKATLGVDGDQITLAHFPDDEARTQGKPDSVQTLTEAVMGAFKDLQDHGIFPAISDAMGDIMQNILRGPIFSLFSSTNTISRAEEQFRDVDNAYGLFNNNGKGYSKKNSYELKPSELYGKFQASTLFGELPYIKELNEKFSHYSNEVDKIWPTAARYYFVEQAKKARDNLELPAEDYELVMKGGAPGVPLAGPVTFEQISKPTPPDSSVTVQRLDINGYPSTNIVLYKRSDGSGVMYLPGDEPSFVRFRHKDDLMDWLKAQTKDSDKDPAQQAKREAFLNHFSLYNRMDGSFHSGVETGLDKLTAGEWAPAYLNYNDHIGKNDIKSIDVFEDMHAQTKSRIVDDADRQTDSAWDGWKKTASRTATLLSPLGFVAGPAGIAVGMTAGATQLGLGIDTALHGKNSEDLKEGTQDAVMGGIFTAIGLIPGRIKIGGRGSYDLHTAGNSKAVQGTVANHAQPSITPISYQSRTS